MKERILELLRCPACGHRLSLKEEVFDQGEVLDGPVGDLMASK